MKIKAVLMAVAATVVSLAFLLLVGCGYGFAPRGEHIEPGIKNVYVEPFGNKTAQAEVENYLRAAFIDQIIRDSRFKIVNSAEKADAVISGNALNLSTAALSYRDNILAAEERMSLTLEASFRDKEGKILWSSRELPGMTDYQLQDGVDPTPARKQALFKLTRDAAEHALNLMLSDF